MEILVVFIYNIMNINVHSSGEMVQRKIYYTKTGIKNGRKTKS